jgi:hypothetical protein
VSAALSFWQERGQDFSMAGLTLTIAAIPVMLWLARRTLAIAEQLGSRDGVDQLAISPTQSFSGY